MTGIVKRLAVLFVFAWLGLVLAQPTLQVSPAQGEIGSIVTASASGLEPGSEVTLVWHEGRPEWIAEDGAFFGYQVSPVRTALAVATVAEDGSARMTFEVPEGFGFLHDLTLESGGETIARQGFFVQPTVEISPTSGPVGTPIEIVMKGLGYRNYEFPFQLLYDNAYTGMVTGIATGGSATFTITATGEVGPHVIQIMRGAFSAPYLNGQQAPTYIPALLEPFTATFTITDGEPVSPPPLVEQGLERLAGDTTRTGDVALATDFASGHVGDAFTLSGAGLPADSELQLYWSTVVGNRIGGQGWEEALSDLAAITTDAQGSFRLDLETPDDLGGAHTLTVANGATVLASLQYAISPSLQAFGTTDDPRAGEEGTLVVAPGDTLRLQIKGIGWTETENIITVVHDNSYSGYACGFNSQGDVTLLLPAAPQPGWHYIDLYPAIYKGEMGPVSADPFRLPMLNAEDHPGDRLPVLRVAYFVSSTPQ